MKWKKNEAQNSEARIEKLADEVRSAAYKSMEALWSAFLEVGELDTGVLVGSHYGPLVFGTQAGGYGVVAHDGDDGGETLHAALGALKMINLGHIVHRGVELLKAGVGHGIRAGHVCRAEELARGNAKGVQRRRDTPLQELLRQVSKGGQRQSGRL